MKIALLANAASVHTEKWANGLAGNGHDITLITLHDSDGNYCDNVRIKKLPFPAPWGYFFSAFSLRTYLRSIQPDILHVHYAGGYGTLGSLSGFHPRVVSVWGSDVYAIPFQNYLNYILIKYTLQSADWVCSTSHVMARHTSSHFSGIKNLSIIPFGIDISTFRPMQRAGDKRTITIGTVKLLQRIYGVDLLIRAFHCAIELLYNESNPLPLNLRLAIVGDGPERLALEALSCELGLANLVTFYGNVPNADVPEYLNRFDIFVVLSHQESFGVAVLEASACALPVVVTAVDGFQEVVRNNETGFIVEKGNIHEAAKAIVALVKSTELRNTFGENGKKHVSDNYCWSESLRKAELVYQKVLSL